MAYTIIQFYFVFVLAFLLGIVAVEIFKKESFKTAAKNAMKWTQYFLWFTFVLMVVYLFFSNLKVIMDPTNGKFDIKTFDDLKRALLQSQANIMLISISAFFALAGMLSFVIRMPFANWEQVKIFGFEYKRKIEEIKESAKEVFDDVKKLGILRLQIIDLIASDEVYQSVKQWLAGNTVNGHAALLEVLNVIELFYEKELDIQINAGLVPVVTGQLNREYYDLLPQFIKESVYHTYTSPQSLKPFTNTNSHAICVPMTVGETEDPYFILYLESSEYEFSGADIVMLNVVHTILDMHIARAENEVGYSGWTSKWRRSMIKARRRKRMLNVTFARPTDEQRKERRRAAQKLIERKVKNSPTVLSDRDPSYDRFVKKIRSI